MKIGIIGPEFSSLKIQSDLLAIDPAVETSLYIREASPEAIDVIGRCEVECDATLFTGRGPYDSVTLRRELTKPGDYISKGATSLMAAFMEMQRTGLPLDYFSIDVAEPEVIQDVFSEMRLKPLHCSSFPFRSYNERVYIDWHTVLWDEKKIQVILTGFVLVYRYFQEKGLPVFYLPVTRPLVRSSYERLSHQLALNEASYAQIAVEALQLEEPLQSSEHYYTNMIRKCDAESLIIQYAQKIQGSFFNWGPLGYIVFANKGCIETQTNYDLIHTLQKQVASTGFRLGIGIGLGLTSYEAETNARKGLRRSSQKGGAYLVNGDGEIRGPLGVEGELGYGLSTTDEHILAISQTLEMSTASILKLKALMETRKSGVFDASQLADCLEVSVRSAHRIIKRLLASGYARICAKESGTGAGRPKNLIEINF